MVHHRAITIDKWLLLGGGVREGVMGMQGRHWVCQGGCIGCTRDTGQIGEGEQGCQGVRESAAQVG